MTPAQIVSSNTKPQAKVGLDDTLARAPDKDKTIVAGKDETTSKEE